VPPPEPVPPLPGEIITPLPEPVTPPVEPDETKTMLARILALLEQLVNWFKAIFKV
jgi:hypothetical protein